MDISFSSWFIILLAMLAANLPFFNQRLLAVIPLPWISKPFWLRLLELILLYLLIGIIAHFLESRIGNVFVQGWQFYAVTACLFLVLAFPGYVFCYLYKRRG